MIHLSKDDFLKADDRTAEEVDLSDLPGYHGSVLVRGMTGEERDRFEASTFQRRGDRVERNFHNLRARLVAWCCVDDDGKPLFDLAEVELIGKKSAAAISRIYDMAAKLSGITESDAAELAQDFGKSGEPGDGSPSASPATSA